MTKEEILDSTTMEDVIRSYGITIRHRMCSCPFHGSDKHPSMRVYKTSCYCFACGRAWDIFAFVMEMDGISFKDAFLKLGGGYDHSKNADYFREAKRESPDRDREFKNLTRALQICYSADRLVDMGCPEWHRLKNVQCYLEDLLDEGQYDWRTVEKLTSDYLGVEPKISQEEAEAKLREELHISI